MNFFHGRMETGLTNRYVKVRGSTSSSNKKHFFQVDYVEFQAVIKSAASAASPRGGRASGRLDHGYFFVID